MLTLDTIGKIRRDFHVKGRKIKEIARDRRVARNTVRRVLRMKRRRTVMIAVHSLYRSLAPMLTRSW